MLKGFLIAHAPAVHFCPCTISFLLPAQAHLYNPAAGRIRKLILSQFVLCAPAQTLDSKGAEEEEAEKPCTGTALLLSPGTDTPVLQLHLQQPAARQGTENREWNHIYATWVENSTSFLRSLLPLPGGTGQGCVLGNLLQLTTIKCFSRIFRVYFVASQNWKQTFATL